MSQSLPTPIKALPGYRPVPKLPAVRSGTLQRKAQDSGPTTGHDASVTPLVEDVLRSPGRPLDSETRAFMEPRFGHDFGQVRVHTDARAAESANSVNAHAYTVGPNVVFGTGQFAPTAPEGRRLLAHELAHVVQQSRGTGTSGATPGQAALEHSADQAAHAATTGAAPVAVTGVAPLSLARHEKKSGGLRPMPSPKKFNWKDPAPADVMTQDEARAIINAVKGDAECVKRLTSNASILPAPAAGWARDASVMGLSGIFGGRAPTDEDDKMVCTGIATATGKAIEKAGLPFVKKVSEANRPGGFFTPAGLITGAHVATLVQLTNHNTVVFDWWATMDINDPLIFPSVDDFLREDRDMRFSDWPTDKSENPPEQTAEGGEE